VNGRALYSEALLNQYINKYRDGGKYVKPNHVIISLEDRMKWVEVRKSYPGQWVLVEAIAAHSEGDRRVVEELAVIDAFKYSADAWQRYTQLHHEAAEREFYIVHTDREQLNITERVWLGVRLAGFPIAS
jgi:hypothetical protein